MSVTSKVSAHLKINSFEFSGVKGSFLVQDWGPDLCLTMKKLRIRQKKASQSEWLESFQENLGLKESTSRDKTLTFQSVERNWIVDMDLFSPTHLYHIIEFVVFSLMIVSVFFRRENRRSEGITQQEYLLCAGTS